jgi:hypothetical protein
MSAGDLASPSVVKTTGDLAMVSHASEDFFPALV